MKPICVNCRRFFHPKRNGVRFIEAMPDGNDAKPGLAEQARWSPYKLWMGDLWECDGCHATIIVGTGQHPLCEHFEADFAEQLKIAGDINCGEVIQVNDC